MLLLALLACHHCWDDVEEPCHEPVDVEVVRVLDGDTFEIEPALELGAGGEIDQVRPLCVDAPETWYADDCYGEEATDWMRERLEGEEVRLYFDRDCTDIYGRALAYVRSRGRVLNVEMARQGLALEIEEWFAGYECCDEVAEAVDAAREHGRGGWGECSGAPWVR